MRVPLPLAELGPNEPLPQHVDVQLRNRQQREALRSIFLGLDRGGYRLANGQRVRNTVEAVLWLLEQVGSVALTPDS